MSIKYFNLLCAVGLLLSTTACEKELPKFSDDEGLLAFYYGDNLTTEDVTATMGRKSHSFKLNTPEGQMTDTVWIKVNTIGKLASEDRPLAIQQVMIQEENTINAVEGTHFQPFDDPELNHLYRVPANKAQVEIPIVVLRDASLADQDVVLKITFKDNGYFKAGYPEFSTYTLTISDRLARPDMWDLLYAEMDFGAYGPVKHELMIKYSNKPWDDEFIKTLASESYIEGYGSYWSWNNLPYITYLSGWFAKKLAAENELRLQSGLDVYREADGTEVDFTPISPW